MLRITYRLAIFENSVFKATTRSADDSFDELHSKLNNLTPKQGSPIRVSDLTELYPLLSNLKTNVDAVFLWNDAAKKWAVLKRPADNI